MNFVLNELVRVKSPQENHKCMYRQISIREIRVLELCIEADAYGPRSLQFNLRPERDSKPDLCDAGAMLYKLSYQANWGMFVILGRS